MTNASRHERVGARSVISGLRLQALPDVFIFASFVPTRRQKHRETSAKVGVRALHLKALSCARVGVSST
jgi:hypothetical protein